MDRTAWRQGCAGVGVGGMYVWLSQGIAALPRMGGQVNVAQSCGRKNYEQARSYAACSLQITVLFGLLFAAVCILFIRPLLGFFHLTDAETYSAARSYTLITCGLILFPFLNLTLTGLSTAQGDSRTPLLGQLRRSCRKYASGSTADSGHRTFSPA